MYLRRIKTKFHKPLNTADSSVISIKLKFGNEFRRFGLKRTEQLPSFEQFSTLLRQLYDLLSISNSKFLIRYVDPNDLELLPINNDENLERAIKTAQGILRIIMELKVYAQNKPKLNLKRISISRQIPATPRASVISSPHEFRQLSGIIDVNALPKTHVRVQLLTHGNDKTLGFYIRDGTSVQATPNGLENQPGIFISRLVPSGLAENSGLLAVNDEIIEVNGIIVAGMTLDQVTDLMVANCPNLIITIKPFNQSGFVFQLPRSTSRMSRVANHTNTLEEVEHNDEDEILDLTGITLDDNTASGSANDDDDLHL